MNRDAGTELLLLAFGGWLMSYMADALGNRAIGATMRLTVVASGLGLVVSVGAGLYRAGQRIYEAVQIDSGAVHKIRALWEFIDKMPF